MNPDKAPLLLWLQGGPGKSALFGLFLENGPLGIDAKGKLYRRQTTLRNFANVIYLDQPAGSGFSFTASSRGFAETLEDCSLGIKEFLRQFLIMFPEYKGRNFFAAGESYGGMFRETRAYPHRTGGFRYLRVGGKEGGICCHSLLVPTWVNLPRGMASCLRCTHASSGGRVHVWTLQNSRQPL